MKTEAEIRSKKSYKMFRKFYDMLVNKHIDEQLIAVYEIMDENFVFRSRKNALSAKESLDQLVRDIKENKI